MVTAHILAKRPIIKLFNKTLRCTAEDSERLELKTTNRRVSRGEQKAQTASQKSSGTASAFEGLIELGSCDRVPRNNSVEADKRFFSYAGGNKKHFVL